MTDLPPPPSPTARLLVGVLAVAVGLTALLVVGISALLALYVGAPPWAVALVVVALGSWLAWGLARARREAVAARLRTTR